MVHLFEVPLTLLLILQMRADDAIVIGNMLVLVLIPQDNCVEVEHGEFEALLIL